jgi:branched-chain amino acid transport system permease protein
MITNVLVIGLVNGLIYALFAVGLSLLFGVARVISVVHGSFFMLGAYGVFALGQWEMGPQFSLGPALAMTLFACALLAGVIYWLGIRPLSEAPIAILLITFGVAMAIQEGIRLLFGARPRSVPALMSGSTSLLGVPVQTSRLVAFVGSVVLLGALFLVLSRTKAGRAIHAVAQDRQGATLVGIRSARALALVFVAGSVLAAMAGMLAGPFLPVTPEMWLPPLVKAFAIVILGGLGSLGGTLAAAVVVSYSEATVQFFVAPQFSELVPLLAILVILLVRPYGLFGQPEEA